MLTPYGYSTVFKTLALCALIAAAAAVLPTGVQLTAWTLAVVAIVFTLMFFRDPERLPPDEKGALLAPADGRVVLVKKVDHPYTGKNSQLLSIFMSPFNVHVNRIPMDGTVTALDYHPGKFLMAFDPMSTEQNERMSISLENDSHRLVFTQVSGFLIRRIVCDLATGTSVHRGTRFGMIKFGSRVDLVIPHGFELSVREGDHTRGGVTIVARPDSQKKLG
ncbi:MULTISPECIES: phosphatidylserine decarboxylase [Prosthecochloris]|uniref:Phosphatidylserine decarboxylase proenzyme n=1 Tax=Prosthecochloris vibrioformis TaxID=1098 RepID=A0A5C4S138_PROVB|nr:MULTISPECIES: phosphatidylserine decarboxylase [Prosthecochloris]ANT64360.1 phosphatidylserine decarboxylase [Prosthecochloris sp. CIB 2401]TNJ37216.1 phosphatidylserine decarboxylase [Prosthecochloris vibrioformis]